MSKKRNFLFLFFVMALFSQATWAQHQGCVAFYDHKFCEEENDYSYASEELNWRVSKAEFREKIRTTIADYFHIDFPVLVDVHFWVNDFNTIKSIKVQIWSPEKKFMFSFPVDFSQWGQREKISVRKMGSVPYPLDYGYQFGELIVTCVGDCQKTQFDFFQKFAPLITYQQLTSDVLVVKVPDWQEQLWLDVFQKQSGYSKLFQETTLSPVFEATGFSQLSFRFILN